MTDEANNKPLMLKIDPSTWSNQTFYIWGYQLTRESLTELFIAIEECAGNLASHVEAKYPATDRSIYLSEQHRYERDMTPVHRLRSAVAQVRGK